MSAQAILVGHGGITCTMENDILKQAVEDLGDYLRPYQITPLEWGTLRTGRGSSRYGLALAIALIPSACSPDALAQLVGVIIEKLREPIKARSLVGFQIVFGTEIEGRVGRIYRIEVPLSRFEEVSRLSTLPRV